MRVLFLILLGSSFLISCERQHFYCHCFHQGNNYASYDDDYGTHFVARKKKYEKICKANESKEGLYNCTIDY